MQTTAILALAVGAMASFTKVVRQEEPEVVATLDMYMNSKCLSPDEPRDTITMVKGECYTFDAGYGSFFVHLEDENLEPKCLAGFWDGPDCGGELQWHSSWDKCAENKLGKAFWSASVNCLNETSTSD